MFFVENIQSKEMPVIHHCPEDQPEKIWYKLVDLVLKNKNRINKPKDLTIITFNNTNKKMLLEKNLDLLKFDYLVFGKEFKVWENPHKIKILKEELPKIKTNFVLVLDAEDVVISNNIYNLLEKFKNENCKILYNASSCRYPNEDKYSSQELKIEKSLFRHINSGCFLGNTDYCCSLYQEAFDFEDEVTKKHNYSDQIKIKKFYIEKYPEIKIDSKCKIFQIWNTRCANISCKDILKIKYKTF